MVNEPDNLVLVLLREIRAKLDQHDIRFDQQDARFDRIDRRLEDMHESMVSALGLAAHANIRHESVQQQLEELRERVERLEKQS